MTYLPGKRLLWQGVFQKLKETKIAGIVYPFPCRSWYYLLTRVFINNLGEINRLGEFMKGIFPVTFIVLFLTAIFLFFLVGSTNSAYAESVRLSAELQATEIAGIINIMQSASSDAVHKYVFPRTNCIIRVHDSVTVSDTANKVLHTTPLLKTDAEIKPAEVECNQKRATTLYIIKCGNTIEVLESERRCNA